MTRNYNPARKYKGSLHLICGSMFSGKTEELMRRLRRAEYAQQKVLTIKHHIDTRSGAQCIVSHNGQTRGAYPIDNSNDGLQTLLTLADETIDIIGIDEVQFFPASIIATINQLIDQGKNVIASGLDLDFRGEPFGCMPHLLSIADTVTKLRAICMQCGCESHFSQRIIDGKPARYDDPIVLIGAAESYETRCRDCFVLEV